MDRIAPVTAQHCMHVQVQQLWRCATTWPGPIAARHRVRQPRCIMHDRVKGCGCSSLCCHTSCHCPGAPAGHTPYSLAGSSGMTGGRIQELAEDDDQVEDSSDSTAVPLITATGVQRVRASRHSGVRMELFTSVIHEVPEDVGEVTPAGAVALRCPKTPLDLTPAAGTGGTVARLQGRGMTCELLFLLLK